MRRSCQLEKEHRTVEIVPSKMVLTLKPGPRRRARMVGCGNLCQKQEGQDLYAGGADTVAVRYVLKRGAEEGWTGCVIDIKAAFLNAPLQAEDGDKVVVLKPPHLLVKLGYVKSDEYFLVEKAMYGLRQSPRSWCVYRDQVISALKTKEGRVFVMSVGDPNLWVVYLDDQVDGFILIYVDDFLIMMSLIGLQDVLDAITSKWEISTPEMINEKTSVKYLGMELRKHANGFIATQENYIRVKIDGDFKKVKTPMTKDAIPEVEENPQEEHIRLAQKRIGELLWLTTRTRPEICYAVSKCSHLLLSHPQWVVEQTEQIWCYLKSTPTQGLIFSKDRGEGWAQEDGAGLEVFTDVSFAPGGWGTASHGCVMVFWNKALLFWRSGRQGFPTLSTAEAELVETIEGITLGDSVEALLKEHEPWSYRRSLFTDNQATVALLEGTATGWRTRHLRLRAEHLRWRLVNLEWRVRHLPGSIMPADLGTKVLPVQRFDELKQLMNMHCEKEPEKEATQLVDSKVMKLVVLMTMIQQARGQETTEEDGWRLDVLVLVYTLGVVVLTWCAAWIWFRRNGSDGTRSSLPVTSEVDEDDTETVWYDDETEAGKTQTGARSSHETAADFDGSDVVQGGDHSEGNESLMIHFAPYGEKFHRQRECLGLLQAKKVFSAEPCRKCLKKKKIGEKVFRAEKGDMSVFHGLTACAGKRCVKLTPCHYCG